MKKILSLVVAFFLVLILCLIVAFFLVSSTAWAASSTVTLVWDANTETDLAGYKIYHSAISGGPYVLTATLGKVLTYAHTNLLDGNHCWVATAYDGAGNESGYSNQVCVVTDATAPETPGALRITIVVTVQAP